MIKFFISSFGLLGLLSTGMAKIILQAGDRSQEFCSIASAVEASRAYEENSDKTIILEGGRYLLDQTLVLDGQDAGLTIRARDGTKVGLVGGRRITGWEKGEGAFWTAPVEGVKNGSWRFRMLLVNGRVADRARYPASGRLQNLNRWDVRWMSTAQGGWERKPSIEERTHMIYQKEDLPEGMQLNNAEFTVFHKWDETLVATKEILPEENTIIFGNPTGHPLGAFGVNDYVIWNTEEGMNRPGQWYLDRVNGKLVYWPLPGEDMASIDVVAPALENVIRIEDTSNISLQGLTVYATNTPLITGDFGAKLFDGAISVRNAHGCIFEELEIFGATGWGMKLFGDNLTVKNCHIHHVGAGAIRLIGSNSLIENNHLHDVGLTYPSAIALYVGVTDPNMKDEWEFGKNETHVTLRHNEIHDGPYVGIGIGGRHHVVEYNKIYRVMQVLDDGSGIYATFCGEMILRNNVVRDINPGEISQNHAYYLDELSDGVLVENNISIDAPSVSHNHMAKNNIYRNNIFISEDPMKITLPRCGPHTFERNVFVSEDYVTFEYPNDILTVRNNIFQTEKVMKKSIEMYKRGELQKLALPDGNVITDARLTIEGDDISFDPDSVAHQMGIQPIRGSEAGLK